MEIGIYRTDKLRQDTTQKLSMADHQTTARKPGVAQLRLRSVAFNIFDFAVLVLFITTHIGGPQGQVVS
jgi:hypothetical protein